MSAEALDAEALRVVTDFRFASCPQDVRVGPDAVPVICGGSVKTVM